MFSFIITLYSIEFKGGRELKNDSKLGVRKNPCT